MATVNGRQANRDGDGDWMSPPDLPVELGGTGEAVDLWYGERSHLFAIETGHVESLYLWPDSEILRLMRMGFATAEGDRSAIAVDPTTLRGLLRDQLETLESAIDRANSGRDLDRRTLLDWHEAVTRHQKAATGFNPATGEHVQIPLECGVFKTRLNNVRKHDGSVHRFCQPERVEAEIDRMLAIHRSHREMNLAPRSSLHGCIMRFWPFTRFRMAVAGPGDCSRRCRSAAPARFRRPKPGVARATDARRQARLSPCRWRVHPRRHLLPVPSGGDRRRGTG